MFSKFQPKYHLSGQIQNQEISYQTVQRQTLTSDVGLEKNKKGTTWREKEKVKNIGVVTLGYKKKGTKILITFFNYLIRRFLKVLVNQQ